MSDFRGTPGKWAVGMDGEILSDAGYIVMGTDLVHGNESDRELIAAAPELLEALQRIMTTDDEVMRILSDEQRDAAKTALAKALGH